MCPYNRTTKEQIEKDGLQESEIDWEKPSEPLLPEKTGQDVSEFKEILAKLKSIIQEMNSNERARKDIAGWRRNILVKTVGGSFGIIIADGDIYVEETPPESPDFTMVCEDLSTLLDGLSYKGAITDSVINRKLWISKNMEFNTIFKLDRMARSIARAKKI